MSGFMDYAVSNDLITVFPQSSESLCCWAKTPEDTGDDRAMMSDGKMIQAFSRIITRLTSPRSQSA